MTNAEAKAIIEANAVPVFPLQIEYQDWLTAMNIVSEALEKQIPKKPNYVPDDDTCVYYHWECPECGNYYGHSIKKGIRALYGNSAVYCSRCGQCLDWEGIDDE